MRRFSLCVVFVHPNECLFLFTGTPQYFNIVAKLSHMTSVWDPTTWTPYAYFENGGLVSYDDENGEVSSCYAPL